jgi:hypothetical protein
MTSLRAGRFFTFLSAVTIAGCNAPNALLPSGAEPFVAPAVYSRWWDLTQACSGRRRDLQQITWYRVPGDRFLLRGEPVGGYWDGQRNAIVLADSLVENGPFVRHEMLHALPAEAGHPTEFVDACGSVVTCTSCGPWAPPPGYLLLPADSLDVQSYARLLPRESDGQRWLSLEITVVHERNRAVVLDVPEHPASPRTFAFDIRGPLGGLSTGEIATDSSTIYFAPFATKRWTYEFRVASDLSSIHIPVGKHYVRGGYAGNWASWDSVDVIP